MIRKWMLALLLISVIAAGCSTGNETEEPPPDPLALLVEAADNIRSARTFRLEANHSGADYFASVYLGDQPANVAFRRAIGQYVAEDSLQATVSVLASGLPITIDVFALGAQQWVKLPGTSWLTADFAPGFNPESLISLDSGFQAALAALTELEYIGTASLEDGTGVYHLAGRANGPDVTDLLVGMIEATGEVPVDVYIDQETRFPVRLQIEQPETDPEDPTTWTIDVYDINAEPQLTPPANAVLSSDTEVESTSEVTQESTAEAPSEIATEETE